MTTFYAPTYRLPRAAKIAAAVQLAGLAALTAFTTLWAMLIVMFLYSDDTPDGPAGLLLALAVALPAPSAAAALIAAMVRVRRRGAAALVNFEIATCSIVGALFVAAAFASIAIGDRMPLVGVFAGVGPVYAVYLALAAAVVGAIRRQQAVAS